MSYGRTKFTKIDFSLHGGIVLPPAPSLTQKSPPFLPLGFRIELPGFSDDQHPFFKPKSGRNEQFCLAWVKLALFGSVGPRQAGSLIFSLCILVFRSIAFCTAGSDIVDSRPVTGHLGILILTTVDLIVFFISVHPKWVILLLPSLSCPSLAI